MQNDTSKTTQTPEKETGDIDLSIEKKGEMLLEAISSDDDIAMDSEEDGALVLFSIINLLIIFMMSLYSINIVL